jgi:cytochrome c-type biogenesis protein CcmH/NrfG
VWTSYSARHAAQLIGLPESAVRSCIRDGLVGAPGPGTKSLVPAQLSFRDLAALRTVKALVDAGISLPRIRRDLVAIQQATGTSVAELTVEVRDGRVQVRGATGEPMELRTGQLSLPFDPPAPAASEGVASGGAASGGNSPAMGAVRELPRSEAPAVALPATAEQWMNRALALEERDSTAAIDAYRRSLRIRPECTEGWINLGRLHAETGDAANAHECFRTALERDPDEATAYYNLGVLAQDAGNETDAITLYRRALELDPQLAEAHYNLATLFDQAGDSRSAIRHINEYRKLTR